MGRGRDRRCEEESSVSERGVGQTKSNLYERAPWQERGSEVGCVILTRFSSPARATTRALGDGHRGRAFSALGGAAFLYELFGELDGVISQDSAYACAGEVRLCGRLHHRGYA